MDNTMLEQKIKNLTYVVVVGFVITFLLLIGLYFNNQEVVATNTGNDSTGTSSSDTEYDVSRLTLLDKEKTKELVNAKGTKFIYVGRADCPVCQNLLPSLNQVIDDLDLDMYYLSIDLKNWQTEYEDIYEHLDIETTITSSKGTYTGEYGELLKANGFTPMLLVLKDGKMVDGLVGSRDAATLKTFFEKYI